MNWIILIILFTCAISSTFAQKDNSVSKTTNCSLTNSIEIQVINQRDVENNTHNYWATREVDFRLTNISKCPVFIKLFENFGSSESLPVGFSLRFNERKKQWDKTVSKFEDLELAGFDNFLLNQKQSFTFTDLVETVPFESLKTFPFAIKYRRIIYVSLDKSNSEIKAIESPVFVLTNIK